MYPKFLLTSLYANLSIPKQCEFVYLFKFEFVSVEEDKDN
jgi:hypothetical protein